MDRLQAVAHVRQRARHDHAHRVIEVRDPHLVLDADGSDVAQVVGHGSALLRSGQASARRWSGGRRRGVSRASGAGAGQRPPARATWIGARRRAGGCRRARLFGARAATGAGRASTRLSRMTQARWPSSVAAAVAASCGAQPSVAARSTWRQRAVGPRERLLDVRLGVADQLGEEGEAVRGDARVAARRRGRRAGSSRSSSRRAGAPSATGEIDELLELGPAIRLGEDALAVRVARACRR